jgi:hypothetical protein
MRRRQESIVGIIVIGLIELGGSPAFPASDGARQASSNELRWFFSGEAPAAIQQWFTGNPRLGQAITSAQARVDLYLLAPGAPFVGTKLRGGKLELKVRSKTRPLATTPGEASGQVETWDKWTWAYKKEADDEICAAFVGGTDSGRTAEVTKERFQRKFAVGDASVRPVKLSSRIERGCLAELTRLKVGSSAAWTLAVEDLGDPPGQPGAVDQCASWLLSDFPAPKPQASDSFSYPEWLLRNLK